ncbi:MAG TPA: dihydrofolate reductase family protein, partial [Micromonosporaceae bacterium]
MQRIWPDPAPLDEAGVIAAYAPDRDRPNLRVNFVTSLDGAVEIHGYSRGLSSDVDRLVFGLLRMHADAVMVGAGTLRRENYHALSLDARRRAWRREQGLVECPTLVIVTNALELDPTWEVFTRAPVPPVVLTNSRAPLSRTAALADVAEVVRCGPDAVDLAAGLNELHRRGLTQVLCEGGPHLFGAL